ncbi:PIN-like domain-containing protein [Labilibaculum antarcticum]|uniref:PIN like domain-containing protein n=1 Tax=Labilibaculum antarcticum TaxID=1717717 RepID=A0A1Y1CI74_9BACT|nr:PIN-like domain-containing protein [Labilibaculum antarcticum]BAX80088.1 hypothetical protein ALGA_1714 [Labilibaculum antarcticum]
MKNQFKGYYTPNSEELNSAWKSNETIFVFDTNIFLNLYSYAEKTREDFFEVLEEIQDQIWIPYHVGLEYQRRRLAVIRNEKAVFNKVDDSLTKIEKVFSGDIKQLSLERRFPKLSENTDKLQKDISKLIANYKKSLNHWDDKQPCVRSHDNIREKLNELFENKVGLKPKDQEEINLIQSEGEDRYKNEIPPGYKDSIKEKDEQSSFTYDNIKYERKFGDLILWKQIIKKAKEDTIKNVIFITDDAKEDWWYIINSRGKKRVGPHANLQSEIYNTSDINLFHMYNTSSFLEEGKRTLELVISDSSINEIDKLYKFKLSERLQNELMKSEAEQLDNYNDIISKFKLGNKIKTDEKDPFLSWYKKEDNSVDLDERIKLNKWDDELWQKSYKNIDSIEDKISESDLLKKFYGASDEESDIERFRRIMEIMKKKGK